jgi:tRNA 2-selenouridine synthase
MAEIGRTCVRINGRYNSDSFSQGGLTRADHGETKIQSVNRSIHGGKEILNAESDNAAEAHAASSRHASLANVAQLAEFDEVIDVRSPAEYAEDHVPGALNCPVLSNDERARVGTIYKQISAFEARKIGAALVARNIATHLDAVFASKPKAWRPLVYCWRGGNRSAAMTQVLRQVGWPALQLAGGYKAYRHLVIAQLETLPRRFAFRVIVGGTGSGKSRLLHSLGAKGAQVLDLERLAAHRGSVLGGLPDHPQPSQKGFESELWQALRHFSPAAPVFVEAESRKVGELRVPESLIERMHAAPCVLLDTAKPARVQLLFEEYSHFVAAPALMQKKLDCLVGLYGRSRISAWKELAATGQGETLATELLDRHYDPAYRKSIQRNFVGMQSALVIHVDDASYARMDMLADELLAQLGEA